MLSDSWHRKRSAGRCALEGYMSEPQLPVPAGFPHLLQEIRDRIQRARDTGDTRRERRTGATLLGHRPPDRPAAATGGLGRRRHPAARPRTAERIAGSEGFLRAKHQAHGAVRLGIPGLRYCLSRRSLKANWATAGCPNSLGAQCAANAASQRARCTALVHAANTRQRLEPQRPAHHDPFGRSPPPRAGHHQL